MFRVETQYPVALDSPDHLEPCGTMWDNYTNQEFNNKLYELFPQKPLRIMDLGCSGGGFVKNCLDDGHIAIGLEGSDYSIKRKRAEWATIPDNLFLCDIRYPFQVYQDALPAHFDIITCWEVMEHIPEKDLPALCENVKKHLTRRGYWIMSVSPNDGPPYHVTLHGQQWWAEFFSKQEFRVHKDLVRQFGMNWVRGPNQGAPGSFHFVLSKKGDRWK